MIPNQVFIWLGGLYMDESMVGYAFDCGLGSVAANDAVFWSGPGAA